MTEDEKEHLRAFQSLYNKETQTSQSSELFQKRHAAIGKLEGRALEQVDKIKDDLENTSSKVDFDTIVKKLQDDPMVHFDLTGDGSLSPEEEKKTKDNYNYTTDPNSITQFFSEGYLTADLTYFNLRNNPFEDPIWSFGFWIKHNNLPGFYQIAPGDLPKVNPNTCYYMIGNKPWRFINEPNPGPVILKKLPGAFKTYDDFNNFFMMYAGFISSLMMYHLSTMIENSYGDNLRDIPQVLLSYLAKLGVEFRDLKIPECLPYFVGVFIDLIDAKRRYWDKKFLGLNRPQDARNEILMQNLSEKELQDIQTVSLEDVEFKHASEKLRGLVDKVSEQYLNATNLDVLQIDDPALLQNLNDLFKELNKIKDEAATVPPASSSSTGAGPAAIKLNEINKKRGEITKFLLNIIEVELNKRLKNEVLSFASLAQQYQKQIDDNFLLRSQVRSLQSKVNKLSTIPNNRFKNDYFDDEEEETGDNNTQRKRRATSSNKADAVHMEQIINGFAKLEITKALHEFPSYRFAELVAGNTVNRQISTLLTVQIQDNITNRIKVDMKYARGVNITSSEIISKLKTIIKEDIENYRSYLQPSSNNFLDLSSVIFSPVLIAAVGYTVAHVKNILRSINREDGLIQALKSSDMLFQVFAKYAGLTIVKNEELTQRHVTTKADKYLVEMEIYHTDVLIRKELRKAGFNVPESAVAEVVQSNKNIFFR